MSTEAANQPPARSAREGHRTWWQIVHDEGLKLIIVGLLGGLLAYFFNWLSWRRDVEIRRVEANIVAARQVMEDVTLLITDRWYATFRISAALSSASRDSSADDDRVRHYRRAVIDWNLKSDLMLTRLEMFFDRPRNVAQTVSLKQISQIDCGREFFRTKTGAPIAGLNERTFKAPFIALSHGFADIHPDIQPLLQGSEVKQLPDGPQLASTYRTLSKKRDDLFVHANVFRANLLSEALALQNKQYDLQFIPSHLLKPNAAYGQANAEQ